MFCSFLCYVDVIVGWNFGICRRVFCFIVGDFVVLGFVCGGGFWVGGSEGELSMEWWELCN